MRSGAGLEGEDLLAWKKEYQELAKIVHDAARRGDIPAMKTLAAIHGAWVLAIPEDFAPLDHVEFAEGFDPDTVTHPLAEAIGAGQVEMVRFLLASQSYPPGFFEALALEVAPWFASGHSQEVLSRLPEHRQQIVKLIYENGLRLMSMHRPEKTH